MDQQHLALSLKAHATFANYYPGPNRLIVNSLKRLNAGDFVYLWGSHGVSHLLHACVAESAHAIYLDLSNHTALSIELLDGLENYDLVAIDHFDAIHGNAAWEQALFHLYNRCQQTSVRLLIGAHTAPQAAQIKLADLVSRLNSMLILQLKSLSDVDKVQTLQLRAQHLGLELPLEVAQFLLHHAARDLPALIELLTQLDQASLKAQRKLTVPFVKHVLRGPL